MAAVVALLTLAIPLIAWIIVPATVLYLALRLVRAAERRAASADEALHLARLTAEETARLSAEVTALKGRAGA